MSDGNEPPSLANIRDLAVSQSGTRTYPPCGYWNLSYVFLQQSECPGGARAFGSSANTLGGPDWKSLDFLIQKARSEDITSGLGDMSLSRTASKPKTTTRAAKENTARKVILSYEASLNHPWNRYRAKVFDLGSLASIIVIGAPRATCIVPNPWPMFGWLMYGRTKVSGRL